MRRRRFVLGAGAGAAATLLPWTLQAADAARPARARAARAAVPQLTVRWRTDPERIARMLPPPLTMDPEPHVAIHIVGSGVPPVRSVWANANYLECLVQVSAVHEGRRGMLEILAPIGRTLDQSRASARELSNYAKKDSDVHALLDGRTVRAGASRRGHTLFELETELTGERAPAPLGVNEVGYGAFGFRWRMHPDWRRGEALGPVTLWRRGGFDEGWPVAGGVGLGVLGDPAKTRFTLTGASPLDPLSEFPVVELLGVSVLVAGAAPAPRAAAQARATEDVPDDIAAPATRAPRTRNRVTGGRAVRIGEVAWEAFAPWAYMTYDPPITRNRTWVGADWPASRSALRLTAEELRRLRARPSFDVEATSAVDVVLDLDPALHARLLPAECAPGDAAQLRVLCREVAASDFSTEPFAEAWLFARCTHAGAGAWYALSHIVGDGGDAIFGREQFGYPTKSGEVVRAAGADATTWTVRHLDRDLLRLRVPATGGGAPVSEALRCIGLQTTEASPDGTPQARLVVQPWQHEWASAATVDAAAVGIEWPAQAGPEQIGRPDPWHELDAARVRSVRTGGLLERRLPGEAGALVADADRVLGQRFSGPSALQRRGDPTFLLR
jgi:hypothetical protein